MPNKTKEQRQIDKDLATEKKNAAAAQQELLDLRLLQETKLEKPFRFPKMKRIAHWKIIAERMNKFTNTKDFDNRRCRERVQRLITIFEKTPQTGTGCADLSPAQEILKDLIAEDERTENNKKEESEKEAQSQAAAKVVMEAALEKLGQRVEGREDLDQSDGLDEDGQLIDKLTQRKREERKSKLASTPEKDSPGDDGKYKRRRPIDSTMDYLESKKDLQLKEASAKKDMHERDMRDREEERMLKREQLKFERDKLALEKQKLEMDEEERKRRHKFDREERAGMRGLMIHLLNKYERGTFP